MLQQGVLQEVSSSFALTNKVLTFVSLMKPFISYRSVESSISASSLSAMFYFGLERSMNSTRPVMVKESQFLSITRFWTSVRAVTLSLSSCSSLKTLIASQRYCPLGGRYLFSTLSINSFVMLILKSSGMSMGLTFLRLTQGGGLQETIDSSVGLGLPLWLEASDRRPQGSMKLVMMVEISPTCICYVSDSRLSAIKTPAMFGFLIKFLLYSFSAQVIRV